MTDTEESEGDKQSVSDESLKRYRANIQAEIDSAFLYGQLASHEASGEIAELYRRMAQTELQHAAFWRQRLVEAGQPPYEPGPSWRPRALGWLARRLGASGVLPSVSSLEASDTLSYAEQPESAGSALPADERSHARLISMLQQSSGRGVEGTSIARLEGRHRGVGGNALRAAVLGANDGLVSNLSLVMGVAGADLSGQSILVTGLAGLLAGAISMALGEWLSVQSSRELYARQLAIETEELDTNPDEEAEELALIYRAKGIAPESAAKMARQMIENRSTALDTLAREELGIDPEELGGSAWEAAGASFLLFAFGAVVPVVPFLVLSGQSAIWMSLGVSAVGLFVIGGGITLMTGRSVLASGGRQMAFGLAAAAVTYAIGHLVGVSLGG